MIKMKDISSNPKYNLSLSEVQDLIAKRNSNGLKYAVTQIGVRFFINEDFFHQWFTSEFSREKMIENN